MFREGSGGKSEADERATGKRPMMYQRRRDIGVPVLQPEKPERSACVKSLTAAIGSLTENMTDALAADKDVSKGVMHFAGNRCTYHDKDK